MGKVILLFAATGTRGRSLHQRKICMWWPLGAGPEVRKVLLPLNVRLLNVRLLWAAAFSVVGFPALVRA